MTTTSPRWAGGTPRLITAASAGTLSQPTWAGFFGLTFAADSRPCDFARFFADSTAGFFISKFTHFSIWVILILSMKKIGIILNVSSGATEASALVASLQQGFSTSGQEIEIKLIHPGSSVDEAVKQLLISEFKTIVVVGGDGTINTVATCLAGTEIILGVIPAGTFNHFAKDLKIPLAIEDAIKVILNGRITNIDVGQVNDRFFINNSAIGIYPKLVSGKERFRSRGYNKWWALVQSFLTIIGRNIYTDLIIVLPDKKLLVQSPLVFIGNNKYTVEGWQLGSREVLSEGQLSLFIAHHPTRFRLLVLFWHAFWGHLSDQPDFDIYETTELTIESRKPSLPVSLDGEVAVLSTPIHYKIFPKSLRVLIP
jgi:YegS/Rv2252/BmrU family lipid kinase